MPRLRLVLTLSILMTTITAAQRPTPTAPASRPVGTMSDLMIHILYPASDAVFYISTRTPATDAEWAALQAQTLMLAESANLLMMPGRTRGRAQWLTDAQLLLDAGQAAFAAAKARDVSALEALSDRLYESCVACHEHFRPGYGKRRPEVGSGR
jgi:hypothetical protein